MVIGGGLPFGLLGMVGAQFAPAAHMGALLAGSMPVFVALLSALMLGERFPLMRRIGLGAVVAGVAAVVASSFAGGTGGKVFWGDLLFLAAGVLWAAYTVAYRKSGLTPWHAAALICFWSTLGVIPLWLVSGGTGLVAAPMRDVALQILVQGLLAGLLGLAAYGVAIRCLGPSLAAASGAVVPAVTALGGVFLLGESMTPLSIFGVLLVVIGMWAYAGGPGADLYAWRPVRRRRQR